MPTIIIFSGPSTQAHSQAGLFEITGMSHEIVCPRDAASGLPTGKRQHRPLTG